MFKNNQNGLFMPIKKLKWTHRVFGGINHDSNNNVITEHSYKLCGFWLCLLAVSLGKEAAAGKQDDHQRQIQSDDPLEKVTND